MLLGVDSRIINLHIITSLCMFQNSDVLRLEVFGNMDQNLLQDRLKEFPKLYSALFPTDSIASPPIDVNVYQLLMVGRQPGCKVHITLYISRHNSWITTF